MISAVSSAQESFAQGKRRCCVPYKQALTNLLFQGKAGVSCEEGISGDLEFSRAWTTEAWLAKKKQHREN